MRIRSLVSVGLVTAALAGATPADAASDLLRFFNKDKNQEKPATINDAFDESDSAAPKGPAAKPAQDAKKPAEPARPAAPKQAKHYDRDYIGGMQSYVTRYEDTMIQIARDHNVGFVELRSANPYLDPWIPGDKKKVLIPGMHLLPRAPREGVVINLSEMRMYSYPKSGAAPRTFPIGVGRDGLLTPVGSTTVTRKAKDPVWRPTPRMRKENPALPAEVLPGPDNPMGTHALYLGWPTYAIHGTDKPYSIGRRVSAGCIRMYPEDISRFFDLIPTGTQVAVVDQPVKVGWVGDKFYLEVHPTTEQVDEMELNGGLPGYIFSEEDMGVIVAAAGEYASDLNWPLIRQVVRERRGYPVEIFRRADKPAAGKTEEKAALDVADDSVVVVDADIQQ